MDGRRDGEKGKMRERELEGERETTDSERHIRLHHEALPLLQKSREPELGKGPGTH